jgi:CHC2 zinc finger
MTDPRIEAARKVPIENIVREHRVSLKKIGCELIGGCPRCGGKDRFAVSPAKNLWNCRGCNRAGMLSPSKCF